MSGPSPRKTFHIPHKLEAALTPLKERKNDLHLRCKIHLCLQIYSTWIFEGGKFVLYQLYAGNTVHQNCRQIKGKLSA